jgi:hypothetical protein
MPIQNFGALPLHQATTDPIHMALGLETISKLRRENALARGQQAAVANSMESQVTPESTDEMSTGMPSGEAPSATTQSEPQLNPETYIKELAKVSPEGAIKYKEAVTKQRKDEQDIEEKGLKLEEDKKAHPLKMELINLTAMSHAYDYGKATNWTDQKGISSIVNPYLPPNEQITDIKPLDKKNVEVTHADGSKTQLNDETMSYVGTARDTHMKELGDMIRAREHMDLIREKEPKPKAAKPAGKTELDVASAHFKSSPEFEGMDKKEMAAASADLANEIKGIQQAAVNAKEEPPTYDEAKDQALAKIQGRMIPQVKNKYWFDTPAKYFSNPDDVRKAVVSGKISKEEGAKVLKNGFGFK